MGRTIARRVRLAGQKGMDATASRPPDLRYSKLHFIPEFAFFISGIASGKADTKIGIL